MEYKKIIDKDKLQEFCTGKPIDNSHVEALHLLATVVLVKHFPTLSLHFKDLKQFMYLKACEIRYKECFDSSQSAYSYLYTTFINLVKNQIWQYSRVPNFDDILTSMIATEKSKGCTDVSDVVVSSKQLVTTENNFDTYKEIQQYFTYLSGETPFINKRLPSKDVLNLLLFLRMHEKKLLEHVNLPGFIYDSMDSDATRALYKLSSDLISLVTDDGDE